ncbi:hypothetical protein DFH08DRAFT_988765 [Mycena albidolilacea]|uniref:Secreted protein n=1 Tax=Mycena albidolilacea TaxID=1033008 RepID=A0AAD6Z0L3_9AGAR|nr:hypothetical protein DFH08DRAFT_988765 [Mycena albidolilacea]
MQCKFAIAFIVSLLAIVVSAAPVPQSGEALLPREIEHAPFVGISEVARQPEPEPESETETEEARACRMYACIWYAPSPFSSLLDFLTLSP